MIQTIEYEDTCSKCDQPCTRVRKMAPWSCKRCRQLCHYVTIRGVNNYLVTVSACCQWDLERGEPGRFVTSCCLAAPVAKPKAT